MITGLSWRNAKHQIWKYFIYWISLICTFSLTYSFNSIFFSDVMKKLLNIVNTGNGYDFIYALIFFSVVVMVGLAWFISYMTNYMLKKRSQEISTYMILGVEKKEIMQMLLRESILVGISALIIGLACGVGISEFIEAIVLKLFKYEYSLSPGVSMQAVCITLAYFAIVYPSVQYLCKKRVDKMALIDLLTYSQHNEKRSIQHFAQGFIFLIIATICFIISWLSLQKEYLKSVDMLFSFLLLILSFVLLSMGLPVIIDHVIERNKDWKYKKCNLLIYRLLFSKINSIGTASGIIAILFTISLACIGISCSFVSVMQKGIELMTFDLVIIHDGESYDFSLYEKYLSKTAIIDGTYSYNIYSNKDNVLSDIRDNTLKDYWIKTGRDIQIKDVIYSENKYDEYIKYSDYCNLREMLHLETVEMNENEFIIQCMPYLEQKMEQVQQYKINNTILTCAQISTETFMQHDGYGNGQGYIIVVPDEIVENMEIMYRLFVAKTNNILDSQYISDFKEHFGDLRSLSAQIISSDENGYSTKLCFENVNYITGSHETQDTNQAILLILPMFYIALIVGMMGAVIMAVQLLSDTNNIANCYKITNNLGMQEKLYLKILRKYIIVYFLVPFLPAMICGGGLVAILVPKLLIASFVAPVFSSISDIVIASMVITVSLFCIIYSLYMLAAYITLKREILTS